MAKALRRAQPSVPLRGVVGAKPTVDYPTFDAAAAWQLAVGGLIWFRHATNGVMWPGIVAAIASPVAAAAATPQVAQHDMASNALSAPPATLAAPTTSAPAAAASDSQQRTASGPSVVGFDTEELVVTVQALGDDELFHLTDAALPWLCAFRDAHHFHAYHGAGAGNRRDVATSFARAMNQAFCYEAHQKATVAAPIPSGSTADTQVFGDRSFEAIGGDGGPMDDSGAQDARSTTSSSQHQDASSSDSSSAHTPVSEPASAESAALSVTVSIAASSSAPASTSPAAVKASTVVRTSCSTAADISVTTAVTSSSNERPRGMHRQEQRVVVDTTLTFRAAGAKMVPLNPSLPRQARRV